MIIVRMVQPGLTLTKTSHLPKSALSGVLAVLLMVGMTFSVSHILHQFLQRDGAGNDQSCLACSLVKGEVTPAVALATLDIAFLSDDLTKMPEIIALSRRTLSVIRQNIAFSVVLNTLSVLAAGLGWISPIGGAVLHESGAMAVILNAVRLLR